MYIFISLLVNRIVLLSSPVVLAYNHGVRWLAYSICYTRRWSLNGDFVQIRLYHAPVHSKRCWHSL